MSPALRHLRPRSWSLSLLANDIVRPITHVSVNTPAQPRLTLSPVWGPLSTLIVNTAVIGVSKMTLVQRTLKLGMSPRLNMFWCSCVS